MLFDKLLVWTPCLMHKCVCIWRYMLQNYNYKLHFQNFFIYNIPHVSIGTLAVENLDVCTTCDPWDNNIQLTMVKDRRQQIYPNIVQCLTLTFVDCHRKCHSNRKLTTMQKKWPISPRGGHDLRGAPPLARLGMPFLDNDTCAEGGGGYLFLPWFFFLVWCHPWMDDGMDGWRDGWMDGWVTWKSFTKNNHNIFYCM